MSLAQLSRSVVVAGTETAKRYQQVTLLTKVARHQQGQVLSAMEVRLVRYLAGHAGRFVPQWELWDHLYAGHGDVAAVRMLVGRVWAKLGQAFIERGEEGGYRLSSQRAAELERRCTRCDRPVVAYDGEFVCYGCPSTQHGGIEVGRAEGPGERSGMAWTDEENQFITDNQALLSLEDLGLAVNRTGQAVRLQLKLLGIKKKYVQRTKA